MEPDHNPHKKLYGGKLNTVDEVLGLCREKGQEENWSSLFLNKYFFEQANSMHYDYNEKKHQYDVTTISAFSKFTTSVALKSACLSS